MMMREVYFDNSALSRLAEESPGDQAALIAGLKTLGVLRISALNVLETARTSNVAVRASKLKLYRSLSGPSGTVAPINLPAELIAMICRAHHDGSGRIRAGDQYLYALLTNPDLATDEYRDALRTWAAEHEETFKERHQRMRERFKDAFEQFPEQRFDSEREFIDFTFEHAERTLRGLVIPMYHDATGVELPAADIATFLNAALPIKIFIAAHLHALWIRSVREKGPGKKKAGVVDTDSAIYLNFCDRFITNDKPQVETLCVANWYNPRGTNVDFYTDLRKRLLIG